MNGDVSRTDLIEKYSSMGEVKFYKFLLCSAIDKLVKNKDDDHKAGPRPELDFLECSEKFLILYRRDGQDTYLEISRTFRKAAHKIYRLMLKKKMTERNAKFLNLV